MELALALVHRLHGGVCPQGPEVERGGRGDGTICCQLTKYIPLILRVEGRGEEERRGGMGAGGGRARQQSKEQWSCSA